MPGQRIWRGGSNAFECNHCYVSQGVERSCFNFHTQISQKCHEHWCNYGKSAGFHSPGRLLKQQEKFFHWFWILPFAECSPGSLKVEWFRDVLGPLVFSTHQPERNRIPVFAVCWHCQAISGKKKNFITASVTQTYLLFIYLRMVPSFT